jgi:hypothetical protein
MKFIEPHAHIEQAVEAILSTYGNILAEATRYARAYERYGSYSLSGISTTLTPELSREQLREYALDAELLSLDLARLDKCHATAGGGINIDTVRSIRMNFSNNAFLRGASQLSQLFIYHNNGREFSITFHDSTSDNGKAFETTPEELRLRLAFDMTHPYAPSLVGEAMKNTIYTRDKGIARAKRLNGGVKLLRQLERLS